MVAFIQIPVGFTCCHACVFQGTVSLAFYVASLGKPISTEAELIRLGELFELQTDLLLICSELSQSKIYHALKSHMPPDSALFVGELVQLPKFRGMHAGALKWVRAHAK